MAYENKIQNEPLRGEIIIYQAPNKKVELSVRLEKETVWLTQPQISSLFDTERSVVTKHLNNIFKSGELNAKSNVQKMHIPNSDKPVKIYSLDAIISVGYRVNSKRATQFRVWANGILKQYLIQGYAINEKRFLEAKNKFHELKETVLFLQRQTKKELLKGREIEILDLLADYSKTLSILEQYDNGKLKSAKGRKADFILHYKDCTLIIEELKKNLVAKKEAGDLFGQERGDGFVSVIQGLYQTFGGKELYPTIEDKASNLLYLVIKDHPFSDGNKRTAAFLFVYFLDKSGFLFKESGERKINDNALTALALLIAESEPKEKEIMIAIINNLIAEE